MSIAQMKKIRLGLIGFGTTIEVQKEMGLPTDIPGNYVDTGRGARLLNLAAEAFEQVIPAAVCDINPHALKVAKQAYPGIKTYLKFQDMLSDDVVDAVIVETPCQVHIPMAVCALENNVHILSDVPAVWTYEEAQQLWDAQNKSNAIYMLGANPNFRGEIDAAVDLQQRGLLGEVIYAEAEYVHDLRKLWKISPWGLEVPAIRYCTHSLGPLLRLIREDLEYVSCFGSGNRITENLPDGKDVDDFMAALFRTASNVIVRFMISRVNYDVHAQYHNYRMYTTKGSFEVTRPLRTSYLYPDPAEEQRTLFYSKELPLPKSLIELPVGRMPPAYAGNPHAKKPHTHGGIDYAMFDAFFTAIGHQTESPIGVKEALRMTLPGLFAEESAKLGGQLVRIQYPWAKKD